MGRVSRLEKRLDSIVMTYDRKFRQLACDHVHKVIDDPQSWSGRYHEQCSKCGKIFRENLSEKEYLEFSLKSNKEQCSSERKRLETQLEELKEE